MRKEISPEMYNYNKFPGPQFAVANNQLKSDDMSFLILENVKEGLDATVFSQRFSEILLKYDYIVGDWANEQLRLKGFYKDKVGKKSSRISRLDDYIKEYCNFGCAYFVLENPEPREIKFEEEKAPRRRKSSRKRPSQKKVDEIRTVAQKANKQDFATQKRKDKKNRPDRNKKRASKQEQTAQAQHFVIRKKEK